MEHMKWNKEFFIKLSLLLLFVFVFFDFFTFQKVFYSYDILTLYVPTRIYMYQKLKTGTLPIWSNEMGGGLPIIAEGHGGFFYPFNFLFLIFPWEAALNMFILLHYFLACWFMFLYARELNMKKPAALLASIVFAFNGFSTARSHHFVILIVCIWLPLIFYYIEKIRAEKKLIYFQIISILIAMQFLAFFPQMFFYCVLVTTAYAFVRLSNFKTVALFLLSVALGLLLSGVQLLPTWELVQNSVRAKGIVFTHEAIRDSLSLKYIPALFLPDFSLHRSFFEQHKTVEMQGYVGIIPALLALLALFSMRKRENLFFVILIPIAFCLSFGSNNVLSSYILSLPVFRFFASPLRFLFFFTFCISVLAGLGMDSLNLKSICKVFILLLVLTDLTIFSIHRNFTKANPEKLYTLPVNLAQFLQQDKSIYRIFWEGGYGWLAPNINIVYGIDSANLHTPLIINRYWDLIHLYLEQRNPKILNLLNVKYIFRKNNTIVVNRDALPRAFVVHQARFFKNGSGALKFMASNKFNPGNEVLLEEKRENRENASGLARSPANILKYSSDAVKIQVNLKNSGYLVLADTYYPGWESFVDERETKIYVADYALRAVYLDKGKHTIQFYYRPSSFKTGTLVSLSGVFILLSLSALAHVKKSTPVALR